MKRSRATMTRERDRVRNTRHGRSRVVATHTHFGPKEGRSHGGRVRRARRYWISLAISAAILMSLAVVVLSQSRTDSTRGAKVAASKWNRHLAGIESQRQKKAAEDLAAQDAADPQASRDEARLNRADAAAARQAGESPMERSHRLPSLRHRRPAILRTSPRRQARRRARSASRQLRLATLRTRRARTARRSRTGCSRPGPEDPDHALPSHQGRPEGQRVRQGAGHRLLVQDHKPVRRQGRPDGGLPLPLQRLPGQQPQCPEPARRGHVARRAVPPQPDETIKKGGTVENAMPTNSTTYTPRWTWLRPRAWIRSSGRPLTS